MGSRVEDIDHSSGSDSRSMSICLGHWLHQTKSSIILENLDYFFSQWENNKKTMAFQQMNVFTVAKLGDVCGIASTACFGGDGGQSIGREIIFYGFLKMWKLYLVWGLWSTVWRDASLKEILSPEMETYDIGQIPKISNMMWLRKSKIFLASMVRARYFWQVW